MRIGTRTFDVQKYRYPISFACIVVEQKKVLIDSVAAFQSIFYIKEIR